VGKLQNGCELQDTTPVSGNPTVANPFGMVLLQRQTATNAATLSFVGLGQYPYTTYKLFVNGSNFSVSSAVYLLLQASSDNGNTFVSSSYYSQSSQIAYAASSWGGATTTNSGLMILNAYVGTYLRNCEHTLWNINNSLNYFSHHGIGISNITGSLDFDEYSGGLSSVIRVNAFQLIPSTTTGVYFNGVFSLYGLS
jgi:hypothetical protein